MAMMSEPCSATLICVGERDGSVDEPSFALPLAEGELYPLELIPTPTVRVYNESTREYVETPTAPSSTLKSVLLEERNPYDYLGCC